MPHLDTDTFVLQLHPGGWEKAKEDPSVTDKEFYEKYMTKLEQWESDTKTRARKPDPRKRAIAEDGSTSQAAVASTIDECETTANTYWGHVWSEGEFYSTFTGQQPPREMLADWKIGPKQYKRGYLLDKHKYAAKARIPEIWSSCRSIQQLKRDVVSTDQEDFEGQTLSSYSGLAQNQLQAFMDMARKHNYQPAAKVRKTAKDIPDELPSAIIEVSEDDESSDDDATNRFGGKAAKAVSNRALDNAPKAALEKMYPTKRTRGQKAQDVNPQDPTEGSENAEIVTGIGSVDEQPLLIDEIAADKRDNVASLHDSLAIPERFVPQKPDKNTKTVVEKTNAAIKLLDAFDQALMTLSTEDEYQNVKPSHMTSHTTQFTRKLDDSKFYTQIPGTEATGLELIRRLQQRKHWCGLLTPVTRASHPDKRNLAIEISSAFLGQSLSQLPATFKVPCAMYLLWFERMFSEVKQRSPGCCAPLLRLLSSAKHADDAKLPMMCMMLAKFENAQKLKHVQAQKLVSEHLNCLLTAKAVDEYVARFVIHLEGFKCEDTALQTELEAVWQMCCRHDDLELEEYNKYYKIASDSHGALTNALRVFDVGITLTEKWKGHYKLMLNDVAAQPSLAKLMELFEALHTLGGASLTEEDGKFVIASAWTTAATAVFSKYDEVRTNTSANFRNKCSDDLARITTFASESFSSIQSQFAERYQSGLEALMEDGWANPDLFSDAIERFAKKTTSFNMSEFAKSLRMQDSAFAAFDEAQSKHCLQQFSSIAAVLSSHSSKDGAQATVPKLEVVVGALSFAQRTLACPADPAEGSESWKESEYAAMFAPAADEFGKLKLLQQKIDPLRTKAASAAWSCILTGCKNVLDCEVFALTTKNSTIYDVLVHFIYPSCLPANRIYLVERDQHAVDELEKQMMPFSDAAFDLYRTHKRDLPEMTIQQLCFDSKFKKSTQQQARNNSVRSPLPHIWALPHALQISMCLIQLEKLKTSSTEKFDAAAFVPAGPIMKAFAKLRSADGNLQKFTDADADANGYLAKYRSEVEGFKATHVAWIIAAAANFAISHLRKLQDVMKPLSHIDAEFLAASLDVDAEGHKPFEWYDNYKLSRADKKAHNLCAVRGPFEPYHKLLDTLIQDLGVNEEEHASLTEFRDGKWRDMLDATRQTVVAVTVVQQSCRKLDEKAEETRPTIVRVTRTNLGNVGLGVPLYMSNVVREWIASGRDIDYARLKKEEKADKESKKGGAGDAAAAPEAAPAPAGAAAVAAPEAAPAPAA